MFKIKSDPTFEANIVIVGQGREQTLVVTFKHMPRSDYSDLLQKTADGKLASEELVLKLVEKWNADAELSKANIKLLCDQQPGADWAIITAYSEALAVARKGN